MRLPCISFFVCKNKNYRLGFCGAQPLVMNLHKIAKPLQLFAALPILAANVVPGQLVIPVPNASTVVVPAPVENGHLLQETLDNKQADLKEKAQKIDNYFASKNLPLAGYGEKFVTEAEKNDLPWNLLPAIAMIESTGYKFACRKPEGKNNGFGWGSCKIAFKSIDEAIETVAHHLGGNHPKTALYYEGKDIKGILNTYNPPKIRPDYVKLVTKVMENIEKQEVM